MAQSPAGMTQTVEYEATLDRTVLRRCAPCFERGVITPHPLATGHPDGACPVCGSPTQAEPLETLNAVVDQDAVAAMIGA